MNAQPRPHWPRPTTKIIATLPATDASLLWVSRDGTRALFGGAAPAVQLHDLQHATHLAELGPVDDWVASADVTHDGATVVTAGGGKFFTRKAPSQHDAEFLREWQEARDGEYWPLPSEQEEKVFQPKDHRVWIWNLASRTCVKHLAGSAEKILLVKISPSGSLVIAMDDARKVYAFQTVDGRLLGQWKSPTRASCIAIEREEGRVLVGSESGRLYRLDVRHERMDEIKLHPRTPNFDPLRSLASTPCGRYAVGTSEYGAELFDLERNASLGVMYRKNLTVHSVEVSGDEMRMSFSDGVQVLAVEFTL